MDQGYTPGVSLSKFFLAEQSAFLKRKNREWRHHLQRVRSFIGSSLQSAPPERPVLILGAGSGLEIPWNLAPGPTTGWDLDPTSRLRTLLRWGRWPDWVFEDFTGGLEGLLAVTRRSVRQTWSGHHREPELAARRLAGLIPSLRPDPRVLGQWLDRHRPGLVVGANWMGQLGGVAQRLVEREFGRSSPWVEDPELPDPLAEALEDWTRRTVQAHLQLLKDSGAELCLVYDRALVQGEAAISLGPFEADWTRQLHASGSLSLTDLLEGFQPESVMGTPIRCERWLWTLSRHQRHLVEAATWHQDSIKIELSR